MESISTANVGIIAKDHNVQVIISSWNFIGSRTCVDEAEFRACLVGLYIGINLNKPIILESDSSLVVSYLANDILDRSPFVDHKREALIIMKLTRNLKILKINRRANTAAHEIAKFSFSKRSDGLLFYSVSPCVAYAIMNNCTSIIS